MEFVNKNIKWIGLGGCILAILGLFLPFATVSSEVFGTSISKSINFIDGDGKIVLVAIIISIVLNFFKNDKVKLFSLVSLVIAAIISITDSISVGSAFGDVTSLYGSLIEVHFGLGFYLLFIGLIVAIGSIIYSNFVLNKKKVAVSTVISNQSTNYNQPLNNVAPVQPTVQTNTFIQPTFTQSNTVMEQPTMVQPQQPVQDFSNQSVTCPVCGATLNSGMQFCNQCGNKLN